jgi:hypothetical protein
MQLELVDALGDGDAGPRQKACAHAIGDRAKPQVETGRLDLAGSKRIVRANAAVRRQFRDHAVGQNSTVGWCKGERHVLNGDLTLWVV